jgi:protein-S-isoprenylcysteine O-methyltransferase Ste14
MELFGKTTINPIIFYSGKVCGYFTWIIILLKFIDIEFLKVYSTTYNKYISLVIVALGLVTVFISLINLGRSTRLGIPTGNTEFKSNGIYRISRNPMYLGFNLLTVSSIIYTLNIIILALGIYSVIVYHLIILGEEKYLKERFGYIYLDYFKKVRRYI